MAAPRASWRGVLKPGQLSCSVGLFTAASQAERISFNIVNRKTGNRVSRAFVDSVTGKVVEREDQMKGYEISPDTYLPFEEDEVAAAIPQSDKVLEIDEFIPCDQVDTTYFDRPYYIAPTERADEEVFALIRAGLEASSTAALARTVLFRRWRTVMIRPNQPAGSDHDRGLIGTTLHYDYEVRPAAEVFADLPAPETGGEMIDLARHIIETKAGDFHPSGFTDRYEALLTDLIRAKIEGAPLPKPETPVEEKVVDLLQALRDSAKAARKATKTRKSSPKKPARKAPAQKAG